MFLLKARVFTFDRTKLDFSHHLMIIYPVYHICMIFRILRFFVNILFSFLDLYLSRGKVQLSHFMSNHLVLNCI